MNDYFWDFQSQVDEIYNGIDTLFLEAKKLNSYFLKVQARHKTAGASQRGKYVFRVRETTFSFTMVWEKVIFRGAGTGKSLRIVKYVKPARSGAYTLDKFKEATFWEQELIEKIEQDAAPIRKALKYFGSLHKTINAFAKDNGVQVETKLFRERNADYFEKRKKMKEMLSSL